MTALFTIDDIGYNTNEKGNRFFKIEDEKVTRIGKAEYEAAFEQYTNDIEDVELEFDEGAAIREARKEMEEASDHAAEETINHPKKSKKSKNTAATFNVNGIEISLTEKQVEFIKLFPGCEYADGGYNSGVWVFAIMEHMTGSVGSFFEKPMTVGAIISTLREKNLIYVAIGEGRNKKDSRYVAFTELGLEVVKRIVA